MNSQQDHQKQLKERIYYLHELEKELAKKKSERADILYNCWSDEVDKRLARYSVIEVYRKLKFYRKTIINELIRLDNLRYYAQKEFDKQLFKACNHIQDDETVE